MPFQNYENDRTFKNKRQLHMPSNNFLCYKVYVVSGPQQKQHCELSTTERVIDKKQNSLRQYFILSCAQYYGLELSHLPNITSAVAPNRVVYVTWLTSSSIFIGCLLFSKMRVDNVQATIVTYATFVLSYLPIDSYLKKCISEISRFPFSYSV